MKSFNKGNVIRCMQKALAELARRSGNPDSRGGFQYYCLLEATLKVMGEEESSRKDQGVAAIRMSSIFRQAAVPCRFQRNQPVPFSFPDALKKVACRFSPLTQHS